MRIIIEEYPYPADKVDKVLFEGAFQTVDRKVSIGYVGYYWNDVLKDAVFFLPKVLVDENNMVFGKYAPEDVIHLDESPLSDQERKFIYGFAVWIYRALVVYKKANPTSKIILHEYVSQAGRGKRRQSNTFLDVILSLVDFQRRNHDFIVFTAKMRHSGFNKVNWTKTVAKKSPVLNNFGAPIYAQVFNRKKEVDRDEELLLIYHSILNYVSSEYGFDVKLDLNYEPITGAKFRRYIDGYGVTRLRAIKYKYFSDKMLELWELCYVFFDHSHKFRLSSSRKEYLLAKNFNIVFEAIIDELVGTKRDELPPGLADQEDGKMVDHMYSFQALTNNDEPDRKVYYIGDSKYYKRNHSVGGESVAKQFTYARNVIQWNLRIFLDDKPEEAAYRDDFPKLRDDVTEGYNVIPNFFISATVDADLSYDEGTIERKKDSLLQSRHFENRLFDRDTLLIAHYDVNFLFVLSLYARNSYGKKEYWKNKMRRKFREDIQEMLSARFKFYAMTPYSSTDPEIFFKEHFQMMLGKVYTPYNDVNEKTTFYSLALTKVDSLPNVTVHDRELREKIEAENAAVLECIGDAFEYAECPIGSDPSTKVHVHAPALPAVVPAAKRTLHYVENYLSEYFIFGCIKNDGGLHRDWIFNALGKYKKCPVYNVRLGDRPGAVKKTLPEVRTPRFVVMYEEVDDSVFRAFRVHHAVVVRKDRMERMGYPHPRGDYFCYFLDEEVRFDSVDVHKIRSMYKHLCPLGHPFAPIYLNGTQVLAAL